MKRLAHDYGIDPSYLVFEITERETVRNLSLLEKFVRDLKQEGFQFAVDDFGSGFSSFGYIKRFPIDYIKIDGEFIRNMVSDNRDRAMVKSITTLADELGIATIAEFVENEEILTMVKDSGIRYAQGYHVGRPAPALCMGPEKK
jgi:EAL domain-containing protein (putative c-di-GMP-specific phosphodiesterase class I)